MRGWLGSRLKSDVGIISVRVQIAVGKIMREVILRFAVDISLNLPLMHFQGFKSTLVNCG